MTTVLELRDEELAELQKLTKKKDAAAAVRAAMREYIRYAKRMQLKKLAGKVTMRENWAELEKLELDSQYGRSGSH
jgi:phage gp16-like protein